jgi:predicted permease
MNGISLILFSVAAGFTASGIAASLYRLSGLNPETQSGKIIRTAVLVVAGPSVIFDSAVTGLLKKEWKPLMFWFVVLGIGYWCLGIGLLVIDIASGSNP